MHLPYDRHKPHTARDEFFLLGRKRIFGMPLVTEILQLKRAEHGNLGSQSLGFGHFGRNYEGLHLLYKLFWRGRVHYSFKRSEQYYHYLFISSDYQPRGLRREPSIWRLPRSCASSASWRARFVHNILGKRATDEF